MADDNPMVMSVIRVTPEFTRCAEAAQAYTKQFYDHRMNSRKAAFDFVRPSGKLCGYDERVLSAVREIVFENLHGLLIGTENERTSDTDKSMCVTCPVMSYWTFVSLVIHGYMVETRAGSAFWYYRPDDWKDDGTSNFAYGYQWEGVAQTFAAMMESDGRSLPEVHCWVAVPPECSASGKEEVIDLSVLGLDLTMANLAGMVYERSVLPPPWMADPEKDRAMYQAVPDACKWHIHQINEYIQEDPAMQGFTYKVMADSWKSRESLGIG